MDDDVSMMGVEAAEERWRERLTRGDGDADLGEAIAVLISALACCAFNSERRAAIVSSA